MRFPIFLRVFAFLLLAMTPVVASFVAAPPPLVVADKDKAESRGNKQGDDDKNDDVHPGKSDPPGKAKGHEKNKDKRDKAIATIDGYTITVDCAYDAEANRTSCDIAGVAPEGGKDISFVQVPAAALCGEVVETEAEFVDPDPNTNATGYKSRGSEGSLTLGFEGEVTTGGPVNYWIKTGDGVFPATGPGFNCDLAAATETTTEGGRTMVMSTPTQAPAPATGTLAVLTYACSDVPDDTTGFDWFGACAPNSTPYTFSIMPPGTDAPDTSASTDDGGVATFAEVEPGTWELDLAERSWCQAKSDKVTAEGDVVIEEGQTTSVWIFLCEPKDP